MAREAVYCTGTSAKSADQIWSVVRGFLWDWHPAICDVVEERSEQGALIRAFTVAGDSTLYREQLTHFSDTQRSLAYTHLEGIEAAKSYDARITISETSSGCTITMSAQIAASAARAKEIATGTKAIFESTIDILSEGSFEAPLNRAVHVSDVGVKTLTFDDLPRLAVSVTPPADGPLCLFLHGIGGARTNWDQQLPVAAMHMRAASLDLRGYGESTLGPAQSNVDDYCDDILRIMEVLNADRVVLCGLSYGAWIATSFAMRHPEKLLGLILSGGCTGMSEAGPQEREAFRLSRETPLNAGQSPADFAAAVVEVLCAPDASKQVRSALHSSMAAIPVATYRDALGCFTNPRETFDFARLNMPVMMITGEHDRLAPPVDIESVAGRIFDGCDRPDVRFEVLKRAGHVCNVEVPDAYNALLSDFLKRLSR